jgi:hypothetical protein
LPRPLANIRSIGRCDAVGTGLPVKLSRCPTISGTAHPAEKNSLAGEIELRGLRILELRNSDTLNGRLAIPSCHIYAC